MANLTVLLENMVNHPHINDMFEEDVKALFFAKASPDVNENDKEIFDRFIEAATKVSRKKENDDGTFSPIPPPDYAIILCEIMQNSILWTMLSQGIRIFHHEQFLDEILLPDMRRALAWTSQAAYAPRHSLKFDEKRRPPQF